MLFDLIWAIDALALRRWKQNNNYTIHKTAQRYDVSDQKIYAYSVLNIRQKTSIRLTLKAFNYKMHRDVGARAIHLPSTQNRSNR